jgi:uncharacterized protein (DUF1778 family)
MPRNETRNEKLKLRVTPSTRRKSQTAARAEETLPDRQRFGLSAERWAAFQSALDTPSRPATRMARLLREPSVFERDREELIR